jgi:predicted  nucleic acid-binding Zn-ribbon protein
MPKETTIQSLITQHPDIAQSIKKLESVKVQLDTVAANCLGIRVTDDLSLSVLEQNLNMLNGLLKTVEETRVKEKAPHLERGKAVDLVAKHITADSDKALSHLKNEKIAWINKVAAEKKRVDDLKAKIEKASNYLENLLTGADTLKKCNDAIKYLEEVKVTPEKYGEFMEDVEKIVSNYSELFKLKKKELKATPEKLEAILEAKEELMSNVNEAKEEVQTETIEATIKKVRYLHRFQLLDIKQVPLEWLKLDEEKVKAYISENKDTLKDGVINGVAFFKEISVTA